MNWLSKLDEIVTKLLPEEDRNHTKQRGDMMTIDPLLDMDLNYGAEESSEEEEEQGDAAAHTQPTATQAATEPQATEVTSGEFDDFTEGSLPFEDFSLNNTFEPIAPETSILSGSAASHLSEQPTGDVTTETRFQREEQVEVEEEVEEEALQPPSSFPEDDDAQIAEHRIDASRTELEQPSTTSQSDEQTTPDSILDSQETCSERKCSDRLLTTLEPVLAHAETPLYATLAALSDPEMTKDARRVETPMHMTPASFRLPGDVPSNESLVMKDALISDVPLSSIRRSSVNVPSNESLVMKDALISDVPLSPIRRSSIETLDASPRALPPRNIDVVDRDVTELEVKLPLPDWNSMKVSLQPSMNCLGVVHVRALAAQKLPCPIGSTVQLAVSLAPWKGKVRGEPTIAFEHNGVCVKWDALDETIGCSMVHAWNSEDTPIPTIKLELLFKPIQMLEFSMCSLDLSCQSLMTQPGLWKKQWCQATVSSARQEKGSTVTGHTPLVLVEAAFFPATDEEDEELDKFDEANHQGVDSCGDPSTRMDDGSSLRSSYQLKAKSNVHLLKLQSFWRPARCSVCKKSLIGWKRAFRCEACNIDCCGDCQLQIDLQIPCGSQVAKAAVEKSIQNKMTIDKVLTTIAPVDEHGSKRRPIGVPVEQDDDSNRFSEKRRIGNFRIQVHRACLFETPLPLETEPITVFDESNYANLRHGDYYVRVSCKGSSSSNRTKTVQNTGKPKFDSPEMVFDLPHYGMEYRVDVVDAYSNKAVGTMLVTAQSLLQLQRDRCIVEDSIDAFLPRIHKDGTAKPMLLKMELRTGFKDGFGSDYFVPTRARNSKRNAAKPGSISGWITVDVCIDEDRDGLYGPSPIPCPPRPPNNLDMELLQTHIGRISMIIADIKAAFVWYAYVVSWKNPPLTVASLIVFLILCLRFDTEYIGSLPIFFLVLTMLYLAVVRKTGHLKDRFIRREKESRTKLEIESSVDRSIHRPLGSIHVSVRKGRKLRSRDLGLPGSVGCHIFWHPLRYCENEEEAKLLSSTDKLFKAHHDIGDTNYLYTANPDWESLKESSDFKRLQQIISTQRTEIVTARESEEGVQGADSIEFPALQPIQKHKVNNESCNGVKRENTVSLAPWTKLPGAIVVQVRFMDVINILPGFEDIIGEVAIPVSKLIEKREYRGWFQVAEAGAKHLIRCDENDGSETPRIFLHLKWKQPAADHRVSDADRETSIVVAEEMVRAANRNSRNKLDIIGSSIGALNTVRGIGGSVQSIQNTLGSVVDKLETVRNLFNFSDPRISSLILCVLLCLWMFLVVIPTRAIIFLCGIAHYAATFAARFGPLFRNEAKGEERNKSPVDVGVKEQRGSPLATWFTNALQSVPTDEDLRKAYFWESVRIGERESSKLAAEKRVSRLEQLWNAKWFSAVKIKVTNARKNSLTSKEWHWEHRFAVVHGRRLLIWGSENDFDDGNPPIDRVLLSGHAGLTGLSPLELRELASDELSRVVNIFGRGTTEQLKLMLLVPSQATKETLEETVLSAALKDD